MVTYLDSFLLTAGLYFSKQFFNGEIKWHPIRAMANNLDWIDVTSFDYHGLSDLNPSINCGIGPCRF